MNNNGFTNKNSNNESSNNGIVISGISVRLPESDNIIEFAENLFGGIDMISDDDRRWTSGLYGLPTRTGKLKNIDKFDNEFFGITEKQANVMDPMMRLLLECTFEAVYDSGMNPSLFKGTKTGVFVGAAKSESSELLISDPHSINEFNLTGHSRGMFANGISYYFGLTGPSFTTETACSSSLIALERAVTAIRCGECENAVVAGANLLLKPQASLEFHKLSMLSLDGKCKAFDRSANGYARSEAVVVIFIQKSEFALKLYATFLNIKSNSDGYKEQGVTYPSGKMQQTLLEETYSEIGLDPNKVDFIEAHGTGTAIGDPEELNGITNYLCQNRSDKNPLLIGSVKSNMGHSEHASGLCSLAKLIISIVYGEIPGNLHFKEANPNIPALLDGRLKVVDKNYKWNETHKKSYIYAINSFGFGGSNVHLILQAALTNEINTTVRWCSSSFNKLLDGTKLLVLVPISGRTKSSILETLDSLKKTLSSANNAPSTCLQSILQNIHKNAISNHCHRGFLIMNNSTKEIQDEFIQKCSIQDDNSFTTNNRVTNDIKGREIWFVFSGMGSQCLGMGKALLQFQPFQESIQECSEILKPYNIDLWNLLTSSNEEILESTLNSFVAIAAVQIGLVDLLFSLGIHTPDGIIGHSIGENICPYVEGSSTKEETLLVPYWAGILFQQEITSIESGTMASIGLSWEEAKNKCPQSIYLACNNAVDNITIAGPTKDIQEFVQKLTEEGIFAREIQVGQAFHSPYISSLAEKLNLVLTNNHVLSSKKERSKRWISTSYPQSQWDNPEAKYITPAYFAHNLISPVLFKEALELIPKNSIVIEIGPHCLLQQIMKRSIDPSITILGLSKKNTSANALFCLSNLGKIYSNGFDMNFSVLYEGNKVKSGFRAHEMVFLSHLVKWDHEKSFKVVNFEKDLESSQFSKAIVSIKSHPYLIEYKIHNQITFPKIGYLVLVWNVFSQQQQQRILNSTSQNVPVIFENVKFNDIVQNHYESCINNEEEGITFTINILQGNGKFEVKLFERLVLTGSVKLAEANGRIFKENNNNSQLFDISKPTLSKLEIYELFNFCGYSSVEDGIFQGLQTVEFESGQATLIWKGNFTAYLENLIQFEVLLKPNPSLLLNRMSQIEYAYFNLNELISTTMPVVTKLTKHNTISAPGAEIRGLHFAEIQEEALPKQLLANFVQTADLFTVAPALLDTNPQILAIKQGINHEHPNDYICEWLEANQPSNVQSADSDLESWHVHYGYICFENSNMYSLSGLNSNGQQIMELTFNQKLHTKSEINPKHSWKIPEEWKLEEAASVPFNYALAYYSLIEKAELKSNESILIPFGQNSLFGQAAISMAMSKNCTIFIVVNSIGEQLLVNTMFPEIPLENIIIANTNVQSGLFEYQILELTKGNCVDVVINMAEQTLNESIRCVGQHGRFINISNYPIQNNNEVGMSFLLKNVTFHVITLENLTISQLLSENGYIYIHNGIKSGIIKPIKNQKCPIIKLSMDSEKNNNNNNQIKVSKSQLENENAVVEIVNRYGNNNSIKKAMKKSSFFMADPNKCYVVSFEKQNLTNNLIEYLEFCTILITKCNVKKLIIVVNNSAKISAGLLSYYIQKWKVYKDLKIRKYEINSNHERDISSMVGLLKNIETECSDIAYIFRVR